MRQREYLALYRGNGTQGKKVNKFPSGAHRDLLSKERVTL